MQRASSLVLLLGGVGRASTSASTTSITASTRLPFVASTTAAFSTKASAEQVSKEKQHQDIHVPVGTDGAGEYTAATKGCFDVIQKATPLVLDSVKAVLSKHHKDLGDAAAAFAIADYGTADGGTSLGLMSQIVQQVHANNADREIVIHYEDQLVNEWKSVFRHALGEIAVTDAYGQAITSPYLIGGGSNKVFVQACGVGFHSQCFPSSTIDLGVRFTAMHWLSASPNSLRGKPEMHAAQCSPTPKLEQAQASDDWHSILEARAREMKPGSRMILVNFCVSKEGYFLGQTDTGASMWESFDQAWKRLHADGHIDDQELTSISFPSYYRTTEEFLQGVDSVPSLEVVSCQEHVVPCPYREQWIAGHAKNSATGKPITTASEYAKWFVPTTRTWSHSTFSNALGTQRTADEKEAILERFWQNYMDIVAQNPDEHGMDYVHNYIVLEKKA